MEVLTGVKAGERQKDGTFEDGTVNCKVDNRLREMAEKLREFPSSFVEEGKKSGSQQ
jgi:hypothetical protein